MNENEAVILLNDILPEYIMDYDIERYVEAAAGWYEGVPIDRDSFMDYELQAIDVLTDIESICNGNEMRFIGMDVARMVCEQPASKIGVPIGEFFE